MSQKTLHPALTGWRDRPSAYGRVSRLFHWIMAAYLLWQFGIILAYDFLGESEPLNAIASVGPSHGMVGVVVIVAVLFRALWALSNRRSCGDGGVASAGAAGWYAVEDGGAEAIRSPLTAKHSPEIESQGQCPAFQHLHVAAS